MPELPEVETIRKDLLENIKSNKFLKSIYFPIILLILVNFFVYSHIIKHFFYSDDFMWLHYGELVKIDFVNIFRLKVTSFFSPVVNFYFFIGQTLFPFKSSVYHLTGIGFHTLNSILVYLVIFKLLRSRLPAFLGSLYFSVAFYHYEAIIWISSIMHVLVTTFVLAGILLYLNYLKDHKVIFLVTSLLLGVLAFFTKENGIIFVPLIVGFYFFYFRENSCKFKNYKHLVPYFTLFSFLAIYAFFIQRSSVWVKNGVYNISIKATYKLFNSILGLVSFDSAKWLAVRPVIVGLVFIGLIVFTLFIFFKKYKLGRVWLLGFYIMICCFAPVMFFYFGTWKVVSQNRYSYLPAIGMAILVGGLTMHFKNNCNNYYISKILLILFIIYLGFNIILIHDFYNKEYVIIDKQMRGMVDSFKKYEEIIAPQEKILMVGVYPFPGNEYERFLYRYFVDPKKDKNLDHWKTEENIEEAEKIQNQDNNYLFLKWSFKDNAIYIDNK